MITCRELIDFLSDYLENELPAGERAAFDEHLAVCPECRQYVESYRMTIDLGRKAFARPDDEPPPQVPPALIQAILEARRRG